MANMVLDLSSLRDVCENEAGRVGSSFPNGTIESVRKSCDVERSRPRTLTSAGCIKLKQTVPRTDLQLNPAAQLAETSDTDDTGVRQGETDLACGEQRESRDNPPHCTTQVNDETTGVSGVYARAVIGRQARAGTNVRLHHPPAVTVLKRNCPAIIVP